MAAGKRERLLIAVALICVGALLVDRFVVSPLLDAWHERSKRIETLRGSIAKGEQLLHRRDSLRERWDSMEETALWPDRSQVEDEAITATTEWSRESDLTLTSLKPRWTEHPDENYNELDIRLSARGSLRALTAFLFGLESSDMPIRLREAELSSRDDKGAELNLNLRFSFLVLTGEEGA